MLLVWERRREKCARSDQLAKTSGQEGDEDAQKNLKMALEKFDEPGQLRTRK
jgi:hypothetical protein